jgi:hypothetical protein
MNDTDELNQEYAAIAELAEELKVVLPYCTIKNLYGTRLYIGLSGNVSFAKFAEHNPTISKKQLIRFFDYCEKEQEMFKEALKQVTR